MNLFNLMYENKGAGIDKDAPPKTGLRLLFEIVRRDGWDICKLSALCLLCCLPVVTIPAALAGLHTAVMRILQDIPGDPWYDFRQGFRANSKKAYPLTLCFVLAQAALVLAFRFYLAQQGPASWLYVICGAFLLLTGMAAVYVFPMLTVVDLSAKAILKNAFLLALARPHHAAVGVAAAALMAAIAGLLPVMMLPLWLIVTISVICVVSDWAAWSDIKAFILR